MKNFLQGFLYTLVAEEALLVLIGLGLLLAWVCD